MQRIQFVEQRSVEYLTLLGSEVALRIRACGSGLSMLLLSSPLNLKFQNDKVLIFTDAYILI
jgi:hypothetical protein